MIVQRNYYVTFGELIFRAILLVATSFFFQLTSASSMPTVRLHLYQKPSGTGLVILMGCHLGGELTPARRDPKTLIRAESPRDIAGCKGESIHPD